MSFNSHSFVYQKHVSSFKRPTGFEIVPPEVIISCPPQPSKKSEFIERSHREFEFSNVPTLSEVGTCTVGRPIESRGMYHVEGGWPKDVDVTDQQHKARYQRKIEKEEDYIETVMGLAEITDKFLRQNNTIDIYQVFDFEIGLNSQQHVQQAHHTSREEVIGPEAACHTIQPYTVFTDPLITSNSQKRHARVARCTSWQSYDVTQMNRLAVAYAGSDSSTYC
eukprot:PhF_6_TR42929/c0_g2_i1/m.65144/K11143/DNAI2; dynein intermediate chain 2, axonemal